MFPIKKLEAKTLYLCIGKKYLKVLETELIDTSFYKVPFKIVGDQKIINKQNKWICTCGKELCWHIFTIMYNKKSVTKETKLSDFLPLDNNLD